MSGLNIGLIWAEEQPHNFESNKPSDSGPPPRRRLSLPYVRKNSRPQRQAQRQSDKQVDKAAQIDERAEAEASQAEPPIPPFPNYPESPKPRPPRAPKQEYLYLNHLYFEPLTLAVGGFVSFGYLGMVGSARALHLGLDIYNAGTNVSLLIQGLNENPRYYLTGILLRLGIHFFLNRTQLKGFDFGVDLRSGLIVVPTSSNAVVVQATLEIPVSYRFILTFYSRTGRPQLNLGIAPYIVLGVGSFLATSTTTAILSEDRAFAEYLSNGNLFLEPNFISYIDPIALRIALRFGFDVSFIF